MRISIKPIGKGPADFGSESAAQSSVLTKKSSLPHEDSADLPAEFRGADEDQFNTPKEQSKLAKLCQQTTSVLASVLPAPFGGHKRSILCQFFGQVQVGNQRLKPDHNGHGLPPHIHERPETVSVLQHQHNPPITIMGTAKHPIQMVLEEEQRAMHSPKGQARVNPMIPVEHTTDLKASASVVDRAYMQRLEAPMSMQKEQLKRTKNALIKYSTPLAENSFKPSSNRAILEPQKMSTSGWKIFNQTFDSSSDSPTTIKTLKGSLPTITTTPSSKPMEESKPINNSTVSSPIKVYKPNDMEKRNSSLDETGNSRNTNKLLVIGRPPAYGHEQKASPVKTRNIKLVSITTKRNNTAKSISRSHPTGQLTTPAIRTIEISAQRSPNLTSYEYSMEKPISSTTTRKPTSELGQSQKREELVIASINNLTRIAFGNQLRDTVKVINKLIDQQSDLFKAKSSDDPMATSESKRHESYLESNDKVNQLVKIDESVAKTRQNQISSRTNSNSKDMNIKPKKSPADSIAERPTSMSLNKKKARISTTPVFDKSNFAFSPLSERSSTPFVSVNRGLTGARSVSRSLTLDITRKPTRIAQTDLISTPIISEIHRDKKAWKSSSPSSHQISLLSRTPQPQVNLSKATTRIHVNYDKSSRPADSSSTLRLSSPYTLPSSPKFSGFTRRATDFPSFSSFKTVSDLDGLFSSASEIKVTTADAIKNWTPPKNIPSDKLGSARNKLALALNRLDDKSYSKSNPGRDSLTTLKMSLTTMPSSTTTSKSLQSSGTQSRWIPTVNVMKVSSQNPITTQSIVTQSLASDSLTTRTPQPRHEDNRASNVGEDLIDSSSSIVKQTTMITRNDLDDVKAADSISKYTTHWNDPNELLATDRRHFQQPLPQIANAGEYFSAETIASWPERYQTMISQSDAQTKTTPSFETTRRNGETYNTRNDDLLTSVSSSRHKIDTTIINDILKTTQSMLSNILNLTSVTILPANHKLSSSPPEIQTTNTKFNSTVTRFFGPETKVTVPYTQSLDMEQSTDEDDNENGKIPQFTDEYLLTGETNAPLESEVGSYSHKPPNFDSTQVDTVNPVDEVRKHNNDDSTKKIYQQTIPPTGDFTNVQHK